MSNNQSNHQTEQRELLQRITELQQQLKSRQSHEYRRIALLNEGVRQELQGVIGIDHIFEVLGEKTLTEEQLALLEMISEKGSNILALVQQYCESVQTDWSGERLPTTELVALHQRVFQLEQQLQERDESLHQSHALLRRFFETSHKVMQNDDEGAIKSLGSG